MDLFLQGLQNTSTPVLQTADFATENLNQNS